MATRGRNMVVTRRGLLTHTFLIWSVLGIIWGIAHIAMEWAMHVGNFRRWIILLVAWSALLLIALIRPTGQWAGWGLLGMGVCGAFALPLRHFEWERAPNAWFGVLPRIATVEQAGPAWNLPYNVLIYLGLAIGVALLWSGARMLQGTGGVRHASVRFLLFALILFFPGVIGGFLGRGEFGWGILIEAAMLGIMGLALCRTAPSSSVANAAPHGVAAQTVMQRGAEIR